MRTAHQTCFGAHPLCFGARCAHVFLSAPQIDFLSRIFYSRLHFGQGRGPDTMVRGGGRARVWHCGDRRWREKGVTPLSFMTTWRGQGRTASGLTRTARRLSSRMKRPWPGRHLKYLGEGGEAFISIHSQHSFAPTLIGVLLRISRFFSEAVHTISAHWPTRHRSHPTHAQRHDRQPRVPPHVFDLAIVVACCTHVRSAQGRQGNPSGSCAHKLPWRWAARGGAACAVLHCTLVWRTTLESLFCFLKLGERWFFFCWEFLSFRLHSAGKE